MRGCGTVLVVDRNKAFRALASELAARVACECVGADTGERGLALLGDERPVLAILEVELPGHGGLVVLQELHERFGEDLPVILVSEAHGSAFDRTAGLLVGADDYLVKPVDPGELGARIRRSLRRAAVLQNGNGNGNGEADRRHDSEISLSPREQQILGLLVEGRTQHEIARELVISPKTVATHIQRLLGKLGVHSRAQAVAAAYRRGLVESDVRAHLDVVVATAD